MKNHFTDKDTLLSINVREMCHNTPPAFEGVRDVIAQLQPENSILCFHPGQIRRNVRTFLEGFPGTTSWALKSNPHPEVVKTVIDAGVSEFDVASRGEIEQIHFQHQNAVMHFNHPVKSPEEIRFAHETEGVCTFTVDCAEELDKIIHTLRESGMDDFGRLTMLVRFHDPESNGTENYDFGAKFGATPTEATRLLRTCIDMGFAPGISFHCGSQNRSPKTYAEMIAMADAIVRDATRETGTPKRKLVLNIGGGFPCRYPDGREPDIRAYFDAIKATGASERYTLICEPGRAIVADTMSVLTRVTLRRTTDTRLYINNGFYGTFMELPFVDFMPPARAYRPDGSPITADSDAMEAFSVWGPTCDSLDKLPRPVRLPADIQTGDYIEFGLMGAYTNATCTPFNGFKAPFLVVVDTLDAWDATSY